MTLEGMLTYLPAVLVPPVVGGIMWMIHGVIKRRMEPSTNRSIIRGLVLTGVGLAGAVAFVLALPVSESTKQNLLQVGGLALTAVVAFSSTTVIRDAAAGTAMRFFSPFKRGDYLETDEYFGRVTEAGLLHTELQTEDRALVTLSNSTLLGNSFRTLPASGTIVSTEISLGYDVPHDRVEKLLIEAVEQTGLEDAFVQVRSLGNNSITYRAAGLLSEVDNLLTARSNLRRNVLDCLHEQGVEIVSPEFRNQRILAEDQRFVPAVEEHPDRSGEKPDGSTESVVFEKALEAREAEDLQEIITELQDQKETLEDRDDAANQEERLQTLEERLEAARQQKQRVEEKIKEED